MKSDNEQIRKTFLSEGNNLIAHLREKINQKDQPNWSKAFSKLRQIMAGGQHKD